MPGSVRTIYWDANVFIDYIQATPNRVNILEALLQASSKGDIDIVTSTLSIAEVAFVADERLAGLTDDADAKLDAFWSDRATIRLIEPSIVVMREARALTREARAQKVARVAKSDIIHLATARWQRVDEFHTYETGLVKYAPLCGFAIIEPYVSQPSLPFPPSL